MPSFMPTPLFSIQEAANSTASIPNDDPLATLIANYKTSEIQYMNELAVLKEVLFQFDPIYDNYYDQSLDDITNEMVQSRSEKNNQLIDIISTLLNKHTELLLILNTSNFNSFINKVTNWALDIDRLYHDYISFYTLDVNQSKSECKIRRRPLIRINYLNIFFKNLKNIITKMNEISYSSNILSDLEIIIFKLSKALTSSRNLDEAEKLKCKKSINIANSKDIVSLKPVCVGLNQNDFETLDKYDDVSLHYFNQNEKSTLNFLNIQILFKQNSLFIIENEDFGKSLIFSPLKTDEFKFVRSNKTENKTSLLFNHSILDDKLQICFSFALTSDLSYKLLTFFPKFAQSSIYTAPTGGLGIKLVSTSNNDSNTESTEASLKLVTAQSTSCHQTNGIDLPELTFQNKQPNTTDNNIPLYKLNFTSSTTNLPVAQILNRKSYMQISEPVHIDAKERSLSKKFIQDLSNNEMSDDEESIISNINTSALIDGMEFEPISKLPTLTKVETPLCVTKKSSLLNLDEYQNSLNSISTSNSSVKINKKLKKSSFFGSLSNLLSIKNKSIIKSTKVDKQLPIDREKKVSPTKSIHSMSSLSFVNDTSKDTDLLSLLNLLNDKSACVSKSLPKSKISIWNRNSWTTFKDMNIVLYKASKGTSHIDEYYIGFYDLNSTTSVIESSLPTPLILVKLDEFTECVFNPVDIQVKTKSYKDTTITLLIKPIDLTMMNRLSNSLVNPELINMVDDYDNDNKVKNCKSIDSDLSNQSDNSYFSNNSHNEVSGSILNGTSMTSIQTELNKMNINEAENEEKKEEISVRINKTWSGVGNLYELEKSTNKLKDLNRCVLNVENKSTKGLFIDLIGFEFGNIELKNLKSENFRKIDNLQILISDLKNYIISFDSDDDLNQFNECIV